MGWVKEVPPEQGNKIRLQMSAAGLPLDGMRWRILTFCRDLPGIEFQCEQYERLLTMAENNRRFGPNNVSLPGPDPWRDANIESFGYSQKGVYRYLHLDISKNRAGLCRVYVAPQSWGKWKDAMSGPPKYRSNDVYVAIAKRLAALGIKLDDYVGGTPDIGGTTLDGVTFSPVNYKGLAQAVESAKRANGKTFIEGKSTSTPDAIDLSFLATTGRGFREISWTNGESAKLDFSALHVALSPVRCNIHIDEFGVVIAGPNGEVSLSPDALHHIANELALKTLLKEFLRDKFGLSPWYIDHLFVELPNAANRYGRVGAGVEVRPWKSVRITAGFACNLNDDHECRKTFSLSASF
ncbi:MAG: hypothetical protein ACJ8EJ_02425 [Xanthobacteraceae bacterium]